MNADGARVPNACSAFVLEFIESRLFGFLIREFVEIREHRDRFVLREYVFGFADAVGADQNLHAVLFFFGVNAIQKMPHLIYLSFFSDIIIPHNNGFVNPLKCK